MTFNKLDERLLEFGNSANRSGQHASYVMRPVFVPADAISTGSLDAIANSVCE